jgi:cysteinyl-tRNA synthetase
MSSEYLGETFDIHGGGIDLVFPHHENEMAQSRSAFGRDVMANLWMHNGHLQVESEKMSKSLGNFVTIRDLITTDKFGGRSWPGEVLRLAILKTHYRQPVDFTVKALEEAEKTLDRWYGITGKVSFDPNAVPFSGFSEALGDDLNTPRALLEILASMPIRTSSPDAQRTMVSAGVAAARLLGLLNEDPVEWKARKRSTIKVDNETIEALIVTREDARQNKKWVESDRIRDELAAMGIMLKDNKDGTTTWEPKR